MTDNSDSAVISLLPQRKIHWSSFVLSFSAQAVVVALLVKAGVVQPQKFIPRKADYSVISLLTHTPPPQRPAVRVTKSMLPRIQPPTPSVVARLTAPAPLREKPPEFVPHNNLSRDGLVAVAPRMPQKLAIVKTGVFSTGSQAVPTLAKSARDVQTGGFGDPNGVPANANARGRANIAQVGSFDLPSGPGYGNGTGGARGARGTVASVGFGNGIAAGNSDHYAASPARVAIQQSGFGDTRPVAEAPKVRAVAAAPVFLPVQIISKPNPVYTDEARRLRLEGEVLLEVAFSAKGDVRVLRVLRGLGHGLDEAATRAAQQIKFRPASRNGQPVDYTASLHMIFQLAY